MAKPNRPILSAAYAVFTRNGFGGASMDDVAREARLARATLHTHFDGKTDLFRALAIRLVEAELAAARQALNSAAPVEARAHRYSCRQDRADRRDQRPLAACARAARRMPPPRRGHPPCRLGALSRAGAPATAPGAGERRDRSGARRLRHQRGRRAAGRLRPRHHRQSRQRRPREPYRKRLTRLVRTFLAAMRPERRRRKAG